MFACLVLHGLGWDTLGFYSHCELSRNTPHFTCHRADIPPARFIPTGRSPSTPNLPSPCLLPSHGWWTGQDTFGTLAVVSGGYGVLPFMRYLSMPATYAYYFLYPLPQLHACHHLPAFCPATRHRRTPLLLPVHTHLALHTLPHAPCTCTHALHMHTPFPPVYLPPPHTSLFLYSLPILFSRDKTQVPTCLA